MVHSTVKRLAQGLRPDAEGISKAAKLLQGGSCVAFPTETVYGLGANALNEDAVQSIFTHKGRPLSDPLIVHVTSKKSALELLQLPPKGTELFSSLADKFWPGPLTIVGKAADCIPLKVTASTGFVGIRVPKHPVARALIEAAGLPIAAPSANRFGHVSPTLAVHVMEDLGHCSIGIVDGDGSLFEGYDVAAPTAVCDVGIESTVMKIETEAASSDSTRDAPEVAGGADSSIRIVVFRRGGVSLKSIRAALDDAGFGAVPIELVAKAAKSHADPAGASGSSKSGGSEHGASAPAGDGAAGLEAPGQLLTHYAPDKPTYMVVARGEEVSSSGDCVPITGAAAGGAGRAGDASGAGAGAGAGRGSEAGASGSSRKSSGAAAPVLAQVEGIDTATKLPLIEDCVVIDAGGWLRSLQPLAAAYTDLAPDGDVRVARQHVFGMLRWTESQPGAAVLIADPLVVPGVSEHEDAEAVRDRLFRAASGQLVKLVPG